MESRWVPVLAAAVGVLGGVGGAYVGGSLGRMPGEDNRIASERRAQVQDLRTRVYGDFLRSATLIATKAENG
jgi:hypothetical protein